MYQEIHIWASQQKHFSFAQLDKLSEIKNGIYICFESGEAVNGLDRVVRVGSHPSNGRFYSRLNDHFQKKQRNSIMRKHIGRCFLNEEKDSYLKVWDYTNSQVKKGSPLHTHIDEKKESLIESRVSDHLKEFSFIVIPNLNNDSYRLGLEAKLIATLNKGAVGSSSSWLGLSHPNEKLRNSGLWNIQHLNDEEIVTIDDFDFIKKQSSKWAN